MQNSLILVSFSSDPRWGKLHEQLLHLGYLAQWSDSLHDVTQSVRSCSGVAVCLFDQRSLSDRRKKTIAQLANWLSFPRVGLFLGDQCDWDSDITYRCNDFMSWPCPARELDTRLRRLCAPPCGGSSADDRQYINDLVHLNLIGESEPILEAIDRLKRFARCDAPVLIDGETGTGKELAARAVHYLSDRREHPFMPVNCGALPDTLVENELFGHAKGAFTDAGDSSKGVIAQAEQGTLFLDELESLTPRGQVVLLRFLQEKAYRPLGSARMVPANVRMIAATNVPVRTLQADGSFRQDLLFRLNIMPVHLPPLRERGDDALLLADHFLAGLRRRYGRPEKYLHEEFIEWMRRHTWPGNIRELENLLHRQFLLSEQAVIQMNPVPEPAELPPCRSSIELGSFAETKARVIDAFERDYLARLLAQSGGNVTLAAKRAGKERRAFGKLLKKHGIDKSRYS